MFLYRFMSRQEYELMITGHTLVNLRRHADNGMRTTSVGFCFGEISNTNTDGLAEVEKAYHYLVGLVCPEVCCVFRVEKGDDLRPSKGVYTAGIEDEYCATHYSLESLMPKFVCFNILPSGSSYTFQWRTKSAIPRCAHKMPENKINARTDSQFLNHLVMLLIADGAAAELAAMIIHGYSLSGTWLPEQRIPLPDYDKWHAATHCASMI